MPSKSTTNPAIGSEHRDAMLHSLTLSLEDPHGTLLGLDPVLEREGYSHEEIRSAFGCIDDLLVAIAERKAAYLTTPLTQSQRIDDCPSSDDLRLSRRLRNGGSGSSGFEVMRPAADAASVSVGWSGA